MPAKKRIRRPRSISPATPPDEQDFQGLSLIDPKERRHAAVRVRKAEVAVSGELQRLPLSEIEVPRLRLRTSLEDVPELAESLATVGLLNPIIVTANDGRYRLVAGERRLSAARLLGAEAIDAIVRALKPGEDPYEAELIENAQRRQLSDEDEADAFILLVRQRGKEMQEVARMAGRSVAYVSTRIRVFEDPVLRRLVTSRALPITSVQEFLRISLPERHALAEQAATERWSWGKVRQAVQALLEPSSQPVLGPGRRDPHESDVVEGEYVEVPATDLTWPTEDDAHVPPALRVTHERAPDLARRIRNLTDELNNLRPFQFTSEDDAAMEQLFLTLHRIARAPRERKLVLPSFEEAQALARSRSRR